MNRLQSYAVDSLIPHGAPQPRSRKPAPEPDPSEQSTYHVRRGSLAHLSVRRCAPRQRSTRAPFPSRAQLDRLCSRSPAAFRETSMRNPVVPCVLLYSPLNLRLFTTSAYEPCRDPLDQSAVEDPRCEGDAARRAAFPALRRDLCRAGRRCRDPAGTCTPDALCSDARPSQPSDYQTPCPDGVLGRAAKLLNYRGLIFSPCRNPSGGCSGSLQKGWQLVANDCRARFLTGVQFDPSDRCKTSNRRHSGGRNNSVGSGTWLLGVTWSAGARTQAGAPPPPRKRSLPYAWRPGPAPPSATASGGTRSGSSSSALPRASTRPSTRSRRCAGRARPAMAANRGPATLSGTSSTSPCGRSC